jgi:hypothetical protein
MYRLDKTTFKHQTVQAADQSTDYWREKTAEERVRAATYLILSAYGMLESGYPPMDKSFFQFKNRP